MINTLTNILLSENVVENFYKEYKNSEFKAWLFSVLPEIEDCKNCAQDNPWHIYNCLDHILHSVEEINKLSKNFDYQTKKVLAYTMFLHDIGKPTSKIRRYSKLYKRDVDSFYNHNIESAKIAKRCLSKFGFDGQQKNIIELMVKEHDIFMFITLKSDNNQFHKVLTIDLVDKYIKI